MAEGLVRFSADVQQVARSACGGVLCMFLKQAGIVADHRMTFMERAALRASVASSPVRRAVDSAVAVQRID